jgi:hypothetical protein
MVIYHINDFAHVQLDVTITGNDYHSQLCGVAEISPRH